MAIIFNAGSLRRQKRVLAFKMIFTRNAQNKTSLSAYSKESSSFVIW